MFSSSLRSRRGASSIEYSTLVAILSLASISVLDSTAVQFSQSFGTISNSIAGVRNQSFAEQNYSGGGTNTTTPGECTGKSCPVSPNGPTTGATTTSGEPLGSNSGASSSGAAGGQSSSAPSGTPAEQPGAE